LFKRLISLTKRWWWHNKRGSTENIKDW